MEDRLRELEAALEECKKGRESEKQQSLEECEKNKSLLEAKAMKLTVAAAVGGTIVGKDVLEEVGAILAKVQEWLAANWPSSPNAYATALASAEGPDDSIKWKPKFNWNTYNTDSNVFEDLPPLTLTLGQQENFSDSEPFQSESDTESEEAFSETLSEEVEVEAAAQALEGETPLVLAAVEPQEFAFQPQDAFTEVTPNLPPPFTKEYQAEPGETIPEMAVVPEPAVATIAILLLVTRYPFSRRRFSLR
tara:strand:+ start:872 stop:1618 length:747 start_codon:yes stop_codon:yes gene_type:complete